MSNNRDWEIAVGFIVIFGILFLAFIAISGCTTLPAPAVGGAPVVVPPPSKGAPYANGWSYDELIRSNLTVALRQVGQGDLCPKGAVPEKFWPALFKATAYKESSWKPATTYTEKFPDNAGNYQVSRGLLQLSYDDEGRGPHCKDLKANITNPTVNLLCGVDIADQLVRAKRLSTLRGNLGRYWSTIRSGKVDPLMKQYLPECF